MLVPILPDFIANRIEAALQRAWQEGALPLEAVSEITVERPQNPDHGDFATNLPLRLARTLRKPPMAIAEALASRVPLGAELERVWVAPPGFINLRLRDGWLCQHVAAILAAGEGYGGLKAESPEKVIVEFVSVNPTGPVHVGHTRGAVLGSTLAAILAAAGHQVTREYYVNDAGSQMEAFYRSVYVRYLQALGRDAQLPENAYRGAYVMDLAREIIAAAGDRFLHVAEDEALRELGRIAREKMVALIKDDLGRVGVEFDHWFTEHTLYDSGEYDETMALLRRDNYLARREGALWFTSTALGDDKDNVVVRSNGAPTYFASDIAYHHNKFLRRGFHRGINIWGADHQGHVARMKAAVAALGIDPERLHILISQMVTLKRGDEVVRASKRAGQFVTLRELVDEVGPDACRYFFLARSPGSQMDFDLELATRQSAENPVYYVQYGHARIASVLNIARERGLDWRHGDLSLLKDPNELALVRKMLLLPELVQRMARTLEPHHLPHYALELATAFHWFYENCRVLSSDPADQELTLARLRLVEAAQVVLGRTLTLMGMSAPEHM